MAKDKKTHYVGKAGQLAVMGEFALLGYNVSMPEIDYGDDVFVTQEDQAQMWRIQVKTATPTKKPDTVQNPRSYRYQLVVGEEFLLNPADNPPVYIIFALRTPERWRFLVIGRSRLAEYHQQDNVGYAKDG